MTTMENKPWLDLVPHDDTKWWIASKNIVFGEDYVRQNVYAPELTTNLPTFRAYFIMSDGNVGGSYFRYFFWVSGSDDRYFFTYSKWLFDKPLAELKTGDIVTQINTLQKYVVNDKFSSKYYKIFEIL